MRRTYDRSRYLGLVDRLALGDPRPRARNRPHRRFPRRDGRRLRGDAVAGARGGLRQRVHVHLLAASGHRSGRPSRIRCPTTSSTNGSRRSSTWCRRAPRERNAARVGRVEEVLVEGSSRTDPTLQPRAHAAQHDGQLRRLGCCRRARRRAHRRRRPRRRCVGARRRSSPPEAGEMHTLGTIRDPHVRLSSLRSQRVVGRGAPRGMTKLRYEVVAIFGPTASGKSEVAQSSRRPHRHRGRLRRRAPGLSRPADPDEPAGPEPTRLVAIRDVSEAMSVGEYATLAHAEIDELVATQRVRRRRRRDGSVPPRGARRPGHPAGSSVRRLAPVSNASTTRIRTRHTTRLRELDPAASEASPSQRPPARRPRARARRGRRLARPRGGQALVDAPAQADARRRARRSAGGARTPDRRPH